MLRKFAEKTLIKIEKKLEKFREIWYNRDNETLIKTRVGEEMITMNKGENRNQQQIICIDDLVPENHLLRDIDEAISFGFIYDLVKGLYCEDNGRPSIDPVVLFKIVLIQYLFGIRSMRQTIKEIEVNMAYRWFLGYGMTEKVPHFTTFGKNYVRRFAHTTHVACDKNNYVLGCDVSAGNVHDSVMFDGLYRKAGLEIFNNKQGRLQGI